MNKTTERVAREVADDIKSLLDRVGILCRLFSRAKTAGSIGDKMEKKGYSASGRKMQDLVGVRVVLYFHDDVALVRAALLRAFDGRLSGEETDRHDEDSFRPTRVNLVFRLSDTHVAQLSNVDAAIDRSFEIQIRTILSEGWHEVEHDLRYKCRDDWTDAPDLSRALNGILATLETADWSLLQLFDELSYRQYKSSKWDGMLRAKFRLRLQPGPLDKEMFALFDRERELAKSIFRVPRHDFLLKLAKAGIEVPLTFSSVAMLANAMLVKNPLLTAITPEPIFSSQAGRLAPTFLQVEKARERGHHEHVHLRKLAG